MFINNLQTRTFAQPLSLHRWNLDPWLSFATLISTSSASISIKIIQQPANESICSTLGPFVLRRSILSKLALTFVMFPQFLTNNIFLSLLMSRRESQRKKSFDNFWLLEQHKRIIGRSLLNNNWFFSVFGEKPKTKTTSAKHTKTTSAKWQEEWKQIHWQPD